MLGTVVVEVADIEVVDIVAPAAVDIEVAGTAALAAVDIGVVDIVALAAVGIEVAGTAALVVPIVYPSCNLSRQPQDLPLSHPCPFHNLPWGIMESHVFS